MPTFDEKVGKVETSKPIGGVTVTPTVNPVAETSKLVFDETVPYVVVKEASVPETEIEALLYKCVLMYSVIVLFAAATSANVLEVHSETVKVAF